jgi:hypothetical protein
MWVVQRSNGLCFAREALTETAVALLDSDRAVEPGIACLPELPHPALEPSGPAISVGSERVPKAKGIDFSKLYRAE